MKSEVMFLRLILVFLSLLMFGPMGCSFFQKRDFAYSSLLPEQKKKIEMGYSYLERKDFSSAEAVFLEYLKMYSASALHSQAQFGLGEAYEGLARWEDALSIYHDIIKAYYSEETTASALYRSSLCYEGLGQVEKALMSLLDLRRRKQFLPEDVALASLPARVSALYYRLGNEQEGELFLKEAEAGLNSLKARKKNELQGPWLAEIYYKMGFVPIGEVEDETFIPHVESVRRLQKYLLYSIEVGDPIWSRQSLENLQGAYRGLWNFLQTSFQISISDKMEQEQRKKRRVYYISRILIAMDDLQSQQHPEKKSLNPYYDDLFFYLAQLQKVAETEIAQGGENSLTDEARRLLGPKLQGRIMEKDGAEAAADYLKENARYRKKPLAKKNRRAKRIKKDPNL